MLPAFDALIAQLDADYERLALDEVGLDKFPGGKEAHAWLLRHYPTHDFTAAAQRLGECLRRSPG
ncbi:hypothetical protein [Solimonas sp. SE-A11]|uniref:hypothetical protein n=1 Tax=Solimonas sp. SE-A11 TaxID=3054954 RepID=UPI00259C6E57|nr:hypothetical protein [Solimonas sp. SE-A11]MDM4769944.1 hypothetical protein [Solimonas sp. SE-A11]